MIRNANDCQLLSLSCHCKGEAEANETSSSAFPQTALSTVEDKVHTVPWGMIRNANEWLSAGLNLLQLWVLGIGRIFRHQCSSLAFPNYYEECRMPWDVARNKDVSLPCYCDALLPGEIMCSAILLPTLSTLCWVTDDHSVSPHQTVVPPPDLLHCSNRLIVCALIKAWLNTSNRIRWSTIPWSASPSCHGNTRHEDLHVWGDKAR